MAITELTLDHMLPFLLVPCLTLMLLIGCALFGKYLLIACGIKNLSILGGGLIIGYGILGLCMLFSLKYLSNPMVGAWVFAVVLLFMMMCNLNILINRNNVWMRERQACIDIREIKYVDSDDIKSSLINGLIIISIFSWAIAISLSYLSLCWLEGGVEYRLPETYDLPKHLFTVNSLYHADNWPPPNPFFSGEIFAYNFLFYFPPVFVSKLVGNPLANFQTFPLIVIAMAIALPMTILDIVRSITTSKVAHLISVLLSTWVGGVTPIWIDKSPSMGFFLYTEKLLTSRIWVEELFTYFVFVPQHIFAVLCGLISIFLLVHIRFDSGDYKRMFIAGTVTLSGVLSSLILLPHLLISSAIGLAFIIFFWWKNIDNSEKAPNSLLSIAAFISPIILLIPFLIEILQWSGGTDALIAFPELSGQWFYVLAATGLVVPLALIGLISLFSSAETFGIDSQGKRTSFGMAALSIVGLLGLFFGGYPDAGIKSGLWMRIALVPLAGVGALILICSIKNYVFKIITITCISTLFISIISINFPTVKYFVGSAWLPVDPEIKKFVGYIRSLPDHSRIALFSPEQVLVALTGRQIDFDFSLIRADSYMPPSGRLRAKHFWNGFKQKNSSIWTEIDHRYDYLIAPAGSYSESLIAEKITSNLNIGTYSIFKVTPLH